MSERRALVRHAMLFLAGLAVVLVVAEAGARIAEELGPPALRWYDATTQLKVEQMDARDRADVVFVGTSAAAQALVPSVFGERDDLGRSAYNAGLAGAVPVVTEPWLLDQVVPRLQPSLVVWGLTSLDFSPSWGEDGLDRYTNAPAVRDGTLAAAERAASEVSALVRYRSVLRRPSAILGDEVSGDFDAAEEILGPDGERLQFAFGRSEERGAIIASRLRGFDVDRADVDAVVRTVESLQEQGIDVVLVELPLPERAVEQHPGGAADLELTHNTIQALGEVLEVDVVDMRAGFDDRDFVDYTHLDRGPAGELTAALAVALNGTGDPPSEAPIEPPEPAVPVAPPEPVESVDDEARRAATDVATRAIEINDTLYHYLQGGGTFAGRSEFWYGKIHHHYGRTRDLAVAHFEGRRFEVIFVGSSMMLNAADPELFTRLDGRDSFNAAMPKVGPEVIDLWLEQQALPLADPDIVVYGVAPRDIRALDVEPGTCADSTVEWDEAAGLRAAAFAPVESLAGIDPNLLFFGDPPTPQPSRRVPVHESYVAEYSSLGNRIVFDEPAAGVESETIEYLESWAADFQACPERLDQIRATVTRLTDQGVAVVLVAMPISDLRAEAFGDGRSGVEAILGRIEEAALGAGAVGFIDLSSLLPDHRFRDLAHTDFAGSQAFTWALAEEMARLGL